MGLQVPGRARGILIWATLALATLAPIAVAATSPLLAWRDPVYIAAGFAGIAAMSLLLVQPLLAGGYLPDLNTRRAQHLHRISGAVLLTLVVVHVAALWITSPPDVIDALLFVSPTPFSLWGVVAMWALFAAALLAVLRRRLRQHLRVWRFGHTSLAVIIVGGSVVHALLIEGTMGTMTKAAICALAVLATLRVVADRRAWAGILRRDRDT